MSCSVLGARLLQTYQNTFAYIAKNDTTVEVVSWAADGPADPEVFAWFVQLRQCYEVNYKAAVANKQGAQYFMEAVTSCYGSTAFVFASPNSVYKVTLMNFSSYATPVLFRSTYDIPDTPSDVNEPLFAMDYIVVCIGILALIYAIYYFAHMFLSKVLPMHHPAHKMVFLLNQLLFLWLLLMLMLICRASVVGLVSKVNESPPKPSLDQQKQTKTQFTTTTHRE